MRRRTILLVGLALLAASLVALSAPAAAQNATNVSDVAPYYANQSGNVSSGDWFAGFGNASLDSLGQMATRGVSSAIGTGSEDPSGIGYQGILLTGVVMIASMAGSIGYLRVGATGGSVIAIVAGYGMTELGLAPSYFRIVLVFAIGVVAFVALSRVFRGQ